MTTPAKRPAAFILSATTLIALLFASASGATAEATANTSTLQPQSVSAQQAAPQTFYGGYKTVEGEQAFLDSQVAAHPTLAEKVDFGDSWCKTHSPCPNPAPGFDGYDLLVLHITNRDIPGPKPVFWFDAGIHPNEITPPEIAMRFISWLLDGYDTNADAHWLVDYHDIWIAPIINPDGHHIVEATPATYVQRKNADNTHRCATYPPTLLNMMGTDLNRNFPFKWACCSGASDDPCAPNYRGPSPASEDETQALVAQVSALFPDQRGEDDDAAAPLTATGILQDMHNYAKLDLYPWGFKANPAGNKTDLDSIALHMSTPQAGGNGYTYCQLGVPGCLYPTDGTEIDWAYGELGVPAFSTELAGTGYTLPYDQLNSLWENNRQMLIYMAKIARTPYLLARGPDTNNVTLAHVVVAGESPIITATINYNWRFNNYLQNAGGAEYYIDTPPWAGGVAIPMSPMDGSFDSPTETVQASIDTAALSPGKHIIFVRGHGVNDYEGLGSWGLISAIFLQILPPGSTPPPTLIPAPTPSITLPGIGSRTFPETGHTLSGIFLDYWNNHGGLLQQGYPISDLFNEVSDLDGKPYTVQYFERAVFEYHPEYVDTPYEVLLSQLGTFRYKEQYLQGAPGQTPNTSEGSVLFPQTGKRLGGTFLQYWQQHGGLTQLGYPISDEFTEISDLDGKPYPVQYFERAVLELHPELSGTPYEVLLSQLGTFRYHQLYPLVPR